MAQRIPRSNPGKSRGSCYGFEVRSTLPFDFLRPRGTGAPLWVGEEERAPEPPSHLLQSWPEIPGKRMLVRLYRNGAAFTVTIGQKHRFVVEIEADSRGEAPTPAVRIAVSPTRWPQTREMLLWTTPAAVGIVARGDLALHAAAVEVDGGGILLAGPSGAGKTTTAAAFFQAGHQVLADDLSCCATATPPVVLPGPALLRVPSDAANRLLALRADMSRAPSAKLPFALPADRRGHGAAVPLKAIVLLRQGGGRERIQRLSPVEALRKLWAFNFHLPGDEHRARSFRLLADLVGQVPTWKVARAPDWATLPAVVERIATSLRE